MTSLRVFVVIFFALSSTLHGICIIVPGTWSVRSSWHQPGSSFFNTLESELQKNNESIFTFNWSGKNQHKARATAAYNLANLLEQFDEVTLVTHSHGTNVAILASHILSQRNRATCIDAVYALATPVDAINYFPNMDIITQFYNLFSFADSIQTVFGTFERVYPYHPRIANLYTSINDRRPGHSTIHQSVLAQWIFKIDTVAPCDAQGMLSFFADRMPEYTHNSHEDFELMLEMDRTIQHHLVTSFLRKQSTKECNE